MKILMTGYTVPQSTVPGTSRGIAKFIYYLGKVTARFMAPVIPGDQLRIEVTTVKFLASTGVLKTQAFVKDKLVAEAEIGFGIKEA